MDVRRILRVSEAIKEELNEIVGFEMEDPRLAMVDVTGVLVAPDLRNAVVRVGLSGDERQQLKWFLAGGALRPRRLRRGPGCGGRERRPRFDAQRHRPGLAQYRVGAAGETVYFSFSRLTEHP